MLAQMLLTTAIGGLVGYGYHRWVGCPTGACPIARSPIVSTAVGLFLGVLIGINYGVLGR